MKKTDFPVSRTFSLRTKEVKDLKKISDKAGLTQSEVILRLIRVATENKQILQTT